MSGTPARARSSPRSGPRSAPRPAGTSPTLLPRFLAQGRGVRAQVVVDARLQGGAGPDPVADPVVAVDQHDDVRLGKSPAPVVPDEHVVGPGGVPLGEGVPGG